MTGQPTPDRPKEDVLSAALSEGIWTWRDTAADPGTSFTRDELIHVVLAALEGHAVIDGTPVRLEAMGDDGGWENCYTASGGVGG